LKNNQILKVKNFKKLLNKLVRLAINRLYVKRRKWPMMVGLDGKAAGLFSQFNYIQNKIQNPQLLSEEQTALKQSQIGNEHLNTLLEENETKREMKTKTY
jgi:hypothetical protein